MKKYIILIAILILWLLLFIGLGTVKAETVNQEATPTNSATPLGTSTPYPTNNKATPNPGSGCPSDYPDNMGASFYRNCKMCFEGLDDPLKSKTPTITGTLPTSTPIIVVQTLTPTPTGVWYGLGYINGSTFKDTSPSGSRVYSETLQSTTVCGVDNALVGVMVYETGFDSRSWYIYGNGSQIASNFTWVLSGGTSANGYTGNPRYSWFGDNSSQVLAKASEIHSYSAQINISGLYNSPKSSMQVAIEARTGSSGYTASGRIVGAVCKSSAKSATPTAQPTPTKTLICKTPETFDVVTKMDDFARGLKSKDDQLNSYYHIFPYDVGSYKSLYEREFYNKQFEIDMNVSGATKIKFHETEPEVPVFYGQHKIDFYDCSDNLFGTINTSVTAEPNNEYIFSYPTSLCRVVIETIDDGLEKQFSSKGVSTDGCAQVNCQNSNESGYGYKYNPEAPIGIDIGGWGPNECRLLFEGIDLTDMKNSMQEAIDFINIPWTLPDFPVIPWIMLCVLYWHMPVIKLFEYEIPLGNILLFIVMLGLFRGGGNKKTEKKK